MRTRLAKTAMIVLVAGCFALAGCPGPGGGGGGGGNGTAADLQGSWIFDDGSERVVLTIDGSSFELVYSEYPDSTSSPELRESLTGTFTADATSLDVELTEYRFGSSNPFVPGDPEFQGLLDDFADKGFGDGTDSIFIDYSLSGDQLTINSVGGSYVLTAQ